MTRKSDVRGNLPTCYETFIGHRVTDPRPSQAHAPSQAEPDPDAPLAQGLLPFAATHTEAEAEARKGGGG